MRNLSSRAAQSANAEQTEEVWLHLLTITEPSLGAPLYFVNNNEAVTSRGNIYLPFPFSFIAPGQSDDDPGEATLDIDNVDRSIVETIRAMTSPPQITIETVLASQPDIVEASVPGLQLRSANFDAKTVSGTLVFEDIITEPITMEMTPERFPGMF